MNNSNNYVKSAIFKLILNTTNVSYLYVSLGSVLEISLTIYPAPTTACSTVETPTITPLPLIIPLS